jgi:hypothetical protein
MLVAERVASLLGNPKPDEIVFAELDRTSAGRFDWFAAKLPHHGFLD